MLLFFVNRRFPKPLAGCSNHPGGTIYLLKKITIQVNLVKLLCIDGANLLALSEVLGIPKASISFENYWERVVHTIMTSNWWHSQRPASLVDGQIWDGRVAMLDILFYQPTS